MGFAPPLLQNHEHRFLEMAFQQLLMFFHELESTSDITLDYMLHCLDEKIQWIEQDKENRFSQLSYNIVNELEEYYLHR